MPHIPPVFALLLAAGLLCWAVPGPARVRAVLFGIAAGPFVPAAVAMPLAIGLGLAMMAAAGLSCPSVRLRPVLQALRGEVVHLIAGTVGGAGLLYVLGASGPVSLFAGLLVGVCGPLHWQRASLTPAVHALLAASLVLVLPLLAGQENALLESSRDFFAGVSFVVLVGASGRRAVPRAIQRWTARGGVLGARIVAAGMAVAVALFVQWIGPGLAVGAVLGGLLLHNDPRFTEYLPTVRDGLGVGFAFALGLLVDLRFVWAEASAVLLCAGTILLVHILMVAWRQEGNVRTTLRSVRVLGASAFVVFAAGAPMLFPEAGEAVSAQAFFVAVGVLSLTGGALLRHASTISEGESAGTPVHSPTVASIRHESMPARFSHTVVAPRSSRVTGQLVAVTVEPGAPAVGLSLQQLALHDRCGVQLLALWRDGAYHPHPLPDLRLRSNDRLLLSAPPPCLQRSRPLFRPHSLGR